jgi:hypothetical protein
MADLRHSMTQAVAHHSAPAINSRTASAPCPATAMRRVGAAATPTRLANPGEASLGNDRRPRSGLRSASAENGLAYKVLTA